MTTPTVVTPEMTVSFFDLARIYRDQSWFPANSPSVDDVEERIKDVIHDLVKDLVRSDLMGKDWEQIETMRLLVMKNKWAIPGKGYARIYLKIGEVDWDKPVDTEAPKH